MTFDQKKKEINKMRLKRRRLVRKRRYIIDHCSELLDDEYIKSKLSAIEKCIILLKNEISDLLLDMDTWAYTITGNCRAGHIWTDLVSILLDHQTSEEDEKYTDSLPKSVIKELIVRSYDYLLEFVSKSNSRFAYQVLGVLLMDYGAPMTESLKTLVLKNSEWDDEKKQLSIQENIEERKKYLFDFREKVKNYVEGQQVEVPAVPLAQVFEDKLKQGGNFFIDREPIDFKI